MKRDTERQIDLPLSIIWLDLVRTCRLNSAWFIFQGAARQPLYPPPTPPKTNVGIAVPNKYCRVFNGSEQVQYGEKLLLYFAFGKSEVINDMLHNENEAYQRLYSALSMYPRLPYHF